MNVPFTIAMSTIWKNRVFHHFLLFRNTLFFARAWSDWSTPFINLLYLSIAFGCFTFSSAFHLPSLSLYFLVTVTVSFALSMVVNSINYSIVLLLQRQTFIISFPSHSSSFLCLGPSFTAFHGIRKSFAFLCDCSSRSCIPQEQVFEQNWGSVKVVNKEFTW